MFHLKKLGFGKRSLEVAMLEEVSNLITEFEVCSSFKKNTVFTVGFVFKAISSKNMYSFLLIAHTRAFTSCRSKVFIFF